MWQLSLASDKIDIPGVTPLYVHSMSTKPPISIMPDTMPSFE